MNKKIFIICGIVISMLLVCCAGSGKSRPKQTETDIQGVSVIEITIDGNTCEYIKYDKGVGDCSKMGIAHWTYCKYCKSNNINNYYEP